MHHKDETAMCFAQVGRLFLLAAAVFCSQCTGPRANTAPGVEPTVASKSDCQADGLSGPVRMVTLFEVASGRKTPDYAGGAAVMIETRVYDAAGRAVELTKYDAKAVGRVFQKVVYNYTNGQKTEEVRGTRGELLGTRVSRYNAQQRIEKIDTMALDGSMKEYEILAYDGDGRVSSDELYNSDGSRISGWVFSYSRDGTQTGETKNAHGSYKEVITYDSNGAVTSRSRYDQLGNLESRSVISNSTDANGNLMRTEEQSASSGAIGKSVQKLDSKGNVIENLLFEGGTLSHKTLTSYKYDTYGNWIEIDVKEVSVSKTKVLFKPTLPQRREIEYYDK